MVLPISGPAQAWESSSIPGQVVPKESLVRSERATGRVRKSVVATLVWTKSTTWVSRTV